MRQFTSDEEKSAYYKHRRRIRRLRKRAVIACLLIAIVACVLLFAPFFNIAEISVFDNIITDADAIRLLSNLDIGDNLFRTSTARAIRNIKKLPYIKDVDIKRRLPSKIIITVFEEEVFGYINLGESFLYLAKNGRILEENPLPPEGINFEIKVSTMEEPTAGENIFEKNQEKSKKYLAIMTELSDNNILDSVSILEVGVQDEFSIHMKDLQVIFGDDENLEYKISMLKEILKELGENPRGILDLTRGSKDYFKLQ